MSYRGDCGSCAACCFLLAVPEIAKPRIRWCEHCTPGHDGCTIYQARPAACRAFSCYWLISQGRAGQEMPEAMRPDRSKAMFMADIANPRHVLVHVFAAYPDAWKKGAVNAKINELVRRGVTVSIVIGNKGKVLRPFGTEEVVPAGGVLVPLGA
jgi:hypothetical protein